MKKWIKIGVVLVISAFVIVGVTIGIIFSFSGKDMFGKDHAKIFLTDLFAGNTSAIMSEPGFSTQEKTDALLNYSQVEQKQFGHYVDSSFNSLNRTGDKSILEGTLHFANGDAPICIVEVKVNNVWGVYEMKDVCDGSE